MNIFISYSQRDGLVTTSLLKKFHHYLSGICTPFIHALEDPSLQSQQLGVLRALWKADLVILIVSPAARSSKWVRIELLVARIILCPIISIDAAELTF
jgi:hypothetical protein